MTQQEMHELFDVDTRTLRNWKKSKRSKLFNLLETLDFDEAKNLLDTHSNEDLKRLLENEPQLHQRYMHQLETSCENQEFHQIFFSLSEKLHL